MPDQMLGVTWQRQEWSALGWIHRGAHAAQPADENKQINSQ